MSDFEVKVFYKENGEEKFDRYVNRQIHSCVRATMRYHKDSRIFVGTTTRELTALDKNIPKPPKDWQYARFTCKTKKNRWGRDVAVPEEMNYEVLNGEDEEKVSIQK
tara:strand:- start:5293 stop:5613 length:321 start_codon:yes stop_codon:yes gene_type:complete